MSMVSNGTSRRWILSIVLGALVAGALPLVLSGSVPWRDVPAVREGADPLLQSAILQQTLREPPLTLEKWHAPFHWPSRWSLAYMDPLLGQALMVAWIPGAKGSPALAYNAAMFLTLALAFLAATLFARGLGWNKWAAWLTGWAYATSPYAAANYHHLNQLPSPWLPLALLGVLQLSRGHLMGGVLLAAAGLLQLISGVYYTAVLAIAVVLWLPFLARRIPLRSWVALVFVALGLLALTAQWSEPYRLAAAEVDGYVRGAENVGPNAARWFDLFHAPRYHALPWPEAQSNRPGTYPGLLWVLWSVVGLWVLVTRREVDLPVRTVAAAFVVLGISGVLLSWGRTHPMPGMDGELTMPLAYLQDRLWPLRALRDPSRFFLLTSLILSATASLGVCTLLQRRGWQRILAASLGLLALADLAPGPGPHVRAALTEGERQLVAQLESPWTYLPQPCNEQGEGPRDGRAMQFAALSAQPVMGGSTGFQPAVIQQMRTACCDGVDLNCRARWRDAGVKQVIVDRTSNVRPHASWRLRYEDEAWALYDLGP